MQRVSAFLPSWDKRRSGTKKSVDKILNPLGLHRLSTQVSPQAKVHRESFWPATLDRECDRAARILKSFCTDGYLASLEDDGSSDPAIPKTPTKVVKKIPPRIIQNAAGIAVFTCMRSGLWMTGSGGSGILIARKADGTWSPPSGILLHTPTLSFIIGVDIYDCVLVINDLPVLELLTRSTVTLGEDVPLASGPLVAIGSTEIDPRWKGFGNTIMTYMKARGQSQNVNLSGCILTERANENERFYAGDVTVMDVLAGNVSRHVEETRPLFEVIKAAEGRTDYDRAIMDSMSTQCAPGDAMIETPRAATPSSPRPAFGIPNADDPDPFGVLALEMAGLEIREAGSRLRPTSSQFEYNPSPTSPVFSKFHRQSIDAFASGSNRGSIMSAKTVRTAMSDACTQTDVANTPGTTPSPSQSDDGRRRTSLDQLAITVEPEEIDYTQIDLTPLRRISDNHSLGGTTMTDKGEHLDEQKSELDDILTTAASTELPAAEDEDEDYGYAGDEEEDEDDDEEPVIYEVAAAVQPVRRAVIASQAVQAKGSLVTIPKRIPPPLPIRSPARNSRTGKPESVGTSPLKQAFTEADLDVVALASSHDGIHEETKTVGEEYPEIKPTTATNDTTEGQAVFHHVSTVAVA